MANLQRESIRKRRRAAIEIRTTTTPAEEIASFRAGHTTLESSATTSLKKTWLLWNRRTQNPNPAATAKANICAGSTGQFSLIGRRTNPQSAEKSWFKKRKTSATTTSKPRLTLFESFPYLS